MFVGNERKEEDCSFMNFGKSDRTEREIETEGERKFGRVVYR